jgi:hypothetical protein
MARCAALRAVAGLVAAAAVAALGALILGEYEQQGSLPLVAGLLLGLVLGEVAIAAGRSRHLVVGLVVAGLAFGAMVWAGWIDSGRGLQPIKAGAWWGAAVAAAVALVRVVGVPEGVRRRLGR